MNDPLREAIAKVIADECIHTLASISPVRYAPNTLRFADRVLACLVEHPAEVLATLGMTQLGWTEVGGFGTVAIIESTQPLARRTVPVFAAVAEGDTP